MDATDRHDPGRLLMEPRTVRQLACPRCHGASIHRSRTRGPAEHLLKLFGFRALRCWECDRRFLRFRPGLTRSR